MGALLIILILIALAWTAVKALTLAGAAVIIAAMVVLLILRILAETTPGEAVAAAIKKNPGALIAAIFIAGPIIIGIAIVLIAGR